MSTDPDLVNKLLPRFISILGRKNVLSDAADIWPYGYDNSRRHCQAELVALPVSHEQVKKLVHLCFENKLPVVARGRGTGTTGASIPVYGGVVLSLERMTQFKKIDIENRVAVVEPGITNQAVQNKMAQAGFFWPPDPTSAAYSTIGGNLACNSAGPRAIKYGTPRENILGLKAITGKGEEISTGVYTTKGVVGYDLTRLILGSEGTLAIITEATLKMTPLPQAKRTLQAIYKNIRDATQAVSNIMAQSVIPYTLEFIDGQAIDMVRNHSKIDLPKNKLGNELINIDGERALFVNNGKKAGLNNIKGDEYLVYNDHDLYSSEMVSEFKTKSQLTDIYNQTLKGVKKLKPIAKELKEAPAVKTELVIKLPPVIDKRLSELEDKLIKKIGPDLAQREEKLITEELKVLEPTEFLGELEDQFQTFKEAITRIYGTQNKFLEINVDDAKFTTDAKKRGFSSSRIDSIFSSGEKSNDEVLNIFKERLTEEKSLFGLKTKLKKERAEISKELTATKQLKKVRQKKEEQFAKGEFTGFKKGIKEGKEEIVAKISERDRKVSRSEEHTSELQSH